MFSMAERPKPRAVEATDTLEPNAPATFIDKPAGRDDIQRTTGSATIRKPDRTNPAS